MLRCGSLPMKACIRRRSCQELTLHHALFGVGERVGSEVAFGLRRLLDGGDGVGEELIH
jgi:hypothetical protein